MKKALKITVIVILALIVLGGAGLWGLTYWAKQAYKPIPAPALETVASIDDIVKPYIEHKYTKGLAIATIQGDSVTYFNFGVASDKEPVAPTKESIFEIGSVTKVFTTTILAQMVEEDKVNLDDPISKYLDAGLVNWPAEREITLKELAKHTSGLPRLPSNLTKMDMLANPYNPYKNYTFEMLDEFLKSYEPIPKEERKKEYSNLGMGLLGNILADIDGLSYEALAKKRIFDPLDMKQTAIAMDENLIIQGHMLGEVVPPWDLPALQGAGAIRSNTEDMVQFVLANMKEESGFAFAHQGEGLGWVLPKVDKKGLPIIWHNGMTGGYCSYIGFLKEEQVGVIVLANSNAVVDGFGGRILEFLAK